MRVPSIFSDHMVLQRSPSTRIWGTAGPGETITVTLGALKESAQAGEDGKWCISLNLDNLAPGPFEMTLVDATDKVTVSDVLVGEVWFGSGQSNMEMVLNSTKDADTEIAGSANPQIRQFLIAKSAAATPRDDCEGRWIVAGPETSGSFSAVGYYYIKRLNHALRVPVGLVNSSWGGTPLEAWTSPEALDGNHELAEGQKRSLRAIDDFPVLLDAFRRNYPEWLKSASREDRPANPAAFASEDVDLKDWQSLTLPGDIICNASPANGAFWIRREVVLPPECAGKPLSIGLEVIKGFESVYWNGRKIGETTPLNLAGEGMRRYLHDGYCAPGHLVKAGSNTLAVRIFSPDRVPSLTGYAPSIAAGPVLLEGAWFAKPEYTWSPWEAASMQPPPKAPPALRPPHYLPGFLFNGMISPVIPYTIRGAIWYQGESNGERAWQYRIALPLMITDWRARWQQGDFPFYLCQLPNFTPKTSRPTEHEWAVLRESQSKALALPNTGMAVLIDLGEADDVHPRNKRDVGERLARIALANDYGQDVSFSGPVYKEMSIGKGKIHLEFTHSDLVATPLPASHEVSSIKGKTSALLRNSPRSELEGFAICGEDRIWVWADAMIVENTVIVWNDQVPNPIAARYAWEANPTCNLYNQAGLPAAPFRTDDLPTLTKDVKF